MRFHAQRVSASAAGDYYQLWLGPEESDEKESDPHEVKGPYMVVQRQFEMPDRGRCYLETHDEGYAGHFPLRLTQLSRTRLAFEILRKTDNHVEVSFALNASELFPLASLVLHSARKLQRPWRLTALPINRSFNGYAGHDPPGRAAVCGWGFLSCSWGLG
jgi:hypothetical protein